MAKSMMRFWSPLLLTILPILGANRADATDITVTFSGTPTGSSTGDFSGFFEYDDSHPWKSDYLFRFEGSADTHKLSYKTVPSGMRTGSFNTCEPFTITTSGGQFVLKATVPNSPSTTVTIVVPSMGLAKDHLPGCSIFPSSPPPPTCTFTLSGGFNYTGTIRTMNCSGAAAALGAPCPPPCYVYTCTYPAPALCPAYACPPRPACCLTRLFARRSYRNSCW